MKFASFLAAVAILAASSVPSIAQLGPRVSTEQDVITQGTIPAPEDAAIQLSFGQSAQVYFKRAFKSIRVGDPLTVSASPQNDHIVTFTGLAPGTSSITLEAAEGKGSAFATVTVVRPIHEVKIITPAPRDKTADLIGRNNVSIDMRQIEPSAKPSAEADYRSVLCNDIGCAPVPSAGK